MTTLRSTLLIALTMLAVGACSSAPAQSAVPTASPPPATIPAPSDGGSSAPGDPAASLDPNSPVAPDVPIDSGDGGPIDPTGGRIVVPKPGQLDVRPIAAQTLTATVTGRRVIVSIAYTSGVEPCNVLDSIVVKTGPQSFDIALREGHGPEDVACIEIAEFKRAIVDLGELPAGTYQITDGAGGASPISVTVA